jgi:hypothetical protein
VAALAGGHRVVGHVDRSATRGLQQRDLDLNGDVSPLDGPGSPAAAAAEGIAAEERLEDVREGAEPVAAGSEPAGGEAVPAVPVVDRPALGIGEHLIGLGRGLELLLGLGIVVVHVGVQLAGQRPEGLLDLALAGAAGNAEQLVGVLSHSSYTWATKRDSSAAAWRTAMIAVG